METSHPSYGGQSVKESAVDLLEVAEHLMAPTSEAAHGVGMLKHAVEALELLETKQAPAPIMTPTTPTEADAPTQKSNPLLARLAAKKRAAEHTQQQ